MCGLAAQNKPKLMDLAQRFQGHIAGLNNSQILSGNIPDFNSSQRLLILVANRNNNNNTQQKAAEEK